MSTDMIVAPEAAVVERRQAVVPSKKASELATVLRAIRERTLDGKRVRRNVLGDGRISLDRLLPFLVLYRRPGAGPDLGTAELVTAGAAYLFATGDKRSAKDLLALVSAVRDLSMEHFGAFLLVEIWSRPAEHPSLCDSGAGPTHPAFRLVGSPQGAACDAVLEVLQKSLRKIKSTGRNAEVEVAEPTRKLVGRPKLLFPRKTPDLLQIGIEVEPWYRDPEGATLFPGVLRTARAGLDKALRQAAFHFTRRETKHRPSNYHSLGRRAMVKAVWEVDERLDRISSSFDFLLAITPTNVNELWRQFRKSNYERVSAMRYPPLPIDAGSAKRELFSIPIERIEDPTVFEIFAEKQAELDRQLTMLRDRGSERFLLGGLQLYGRVSRELVRTAEEILERVPATSRAKTAGKALSPGEFVALAQDEIAYYRSQWDGVEARVEMKAGVLAGIMVSQGHLYVASDSRTRRNRADALIQHEVGTHLVTYYNGKAQRFAQLKSGLAGYEELQEGLAVLAEYLVSGMTPGRLRILAARVLSAKALIDGAEFVDTFRMLSRYGFSPRLAFQITVRIYRGGGFIKDCVYLRGLTGVLDYLARGEPLERLFVGKIALEHVPVLTELESRGVVTPPKLLPRYLERDECQRRLAGLRRSKKLYELLDEDAEEGMAATGVE